MAAAGSMPARSTRSTSPPRSTAAANCSSGRALALSAAVNGGGHVRYWGNPDRQHGGPRRRLGVAGLLKLDDLDTRSRAEPQSDRQQRAEGVVAAGARVKGVEEELRPAVEAGRHRGVAGRQPFARRLAAAARPAWCRARADDRRPRRRCRRTASKNRCRRRTASSGRPDASRTGPRSDGPPNPGRWRARCVSSPISERPSSAMRWARIGVVIASRIVAGEPEFDQGRADLRPNWRAPPRSAAASGRSGPSAAARWPRARSPRRKRRCGGRSSAANSLSISSGCLRSSIASGRGQMLLVSSFQNRYLSPFGIDEQVRIDHSAAHLRLAGVVAEARWC